MVARIHPEIGLTVTFYREGQEPQMERAPTGERALKVAIMMLARLNELQDGDWLVVVDRAMKPRQPDWCRVLLAADWLVKHLILQALLPGLTPGQIKDLKRRERKARERRRYFAKLDAAGSHRDSRSVGEARAEEAGAAGAAASVAAVIVRFTSDNIRSRILSSPACRSQRPLERVCRKPALEIHRDLAPILRFAPTRLAISSFHERATKCVPASFRLIGITCRVGKGALLRAVASQIESSCRLH